MTFTAISLATFAPVSRLLHPVRSNRCCQSKSNAIMTEIPGQNVVGCWCKGVHVQMIRTNSNSLVAGHMGHACRWVTGHVGHGSLGSRAGQTGHNN